MSRNSCMTGRCRRATTKCVCVPCMTKRRAACRFGLTTNPTSPAFSYRDSLGNWVHQVNILPEHTRLRVQAESVVLAHEVPAITSWMALGELEERHEELTEEFFDLLAPSTVRSSSRNPGAADQRGRGTLRRNGGRIRAECVRPDSRAVRVCEGRNARQFFYCRFAASGRRSLPGFCSSAAGSVAQARHPGAICLRIPGPAE